MNCLACGTVLEVWQEPQAVTVGGRRMLPGAVCDECARAGGWQPGSPESLERLVRGEIDEEERARLAKVVPSRYDDPADTLRRPGRSGGFEIPETAR